MTSQPTTGGPSIATGGQSLAYPLDSGVAQRSEPGEDVLALLQ